MCGIVTLFNPTGVNQSLGAEMLKDLHHRGPDASGSQLRDSNKLFLGHTRLKIIDVSDGANQPMQSPCGRYTLTYNGEIYNFRELRQELGDFWQWRTESDSEVLLAAWARWGQASLERFVGMFAFAIHDNDLGQVFLVRDRFGIKPLYYVQNQEQWAFASEIQPLLRLRREVRANESTIRTYLESGLYNHGRDTFFEGINAVEPGTSIIVDLRSGEWRCHRWYRLADRMLDLSAATPEELEEEAGRLIEQAITSHLVADVEVGLNVSGGVDSSMLVRTTIEKLEQAHLFNQDYDGYSELPWVREVAEDGILHVANLLSEDIERLLMPTVRSQAEPFGGVTVCGYNALYDLAVKHGVTVLLDGNGVDEIFLGYKRYHQIFVHATEDQRERLRRAAEFEEFWGSVAKHPAEGRSIDGTSGLRPIAMSDHLKTDVSPLPPIEVEGFDDSVRHAAAEDLLHAKIPRGLRFNDRVSMAHSRELRVPFLDHRLVEFAFGIPTEKLFGSKGTKLIFRNLLAQKASDNVAYAAKRSVQSPQREWLANDWRKLVESIIMSDSFRERGWFSVEETQKAYQAYLGGDRENSFFIWQWINLELWANEYLN
jgi:asparagine synthase (glutamine-hydrolysing)